MERGALCISPTTITVLQPSIDPEVWINVVSFISSKNQIWISLGNSINVYDIVTGSSITVLKNVTPRKITAISHHQGLQYVLVGSIDGTSKIMLIFC
jgi:TolB-like protein